MQILLAEAGLVRGGYDLGLSLTFDEVVPSAPLVADLRAGRLLVARKTVRAFSLNTHD